MASQYTRGKQLDRAGAINKMIASRQLTPEGADWLTLRMDPYHDFQRPIAGYPDADDFDTVVSVRNYEVNVSKPAGSAGNWDAHIFTLPYSYNNGSLGTSVASQITESANAYVTGLVNVAKDDAGGPLWLTASPVASGNFSLTHVDTFSGVSEGCSRVIGLGIEIIDTTAALYKQGSLTAYKMPTSLQDVTTAGVLNSAGTMQSNINTTIIRAPPSTVGEAVLYRNAVQWEAKDGCYMAIGQQGVNNPFTKGTKQFVYVSPDETLTGTDVVYGTTTAGLTALQAPPILTAVRPGVNVKKVNVTQSGIFLSGLHNDATFKVRVRVYIERAPQNADTDLIPLASPSAPYDYKALALYSYLQSEMPVAVPVSFNAKGDWWRWILRTVGKLAPVLGTVLTPVLGPEAGMIGAAAGNVVSGISKKADEAEARRKRRNANKK